jgi:hypothetical protein
MAARDKQKVSSYNLLLREATPQNPLLPTSGSRQVRNFIPRKGGYLERKTASQLFLSTDPAIAASAVRRIIDFHYQDQYGGDHHEVLWVKDDGRIYLKRRGGELEVYPDIVVRASGFNDQGSGVTTPSNVVDDSTTTAASLSDVAGAGDTLQLFFADERHYGTFSLTVRSQVFNTAGVTSRIRYSTDEGVNFTNIYSVTTARALQDDTVSITGVDDINDIVVEAHQDANGGGVPTSIEFYDCRIEATWKDARVLSNPRDVAWVVANNKLFISDGDQTLVYLGQRNGGGWYVWGMPRPDKPQVVLKGTGSGSTLTTGRKHSVTWVHIEDGIRIHESPRSDISDCRAVTDQFYRVIRPISPPERATHWSIYGSPTDGATVQYRITTVPIDTLFYDDNSQDLGENGSLFLSIAAPERNDPPPKSQVLALHKARIFGRNEANKNELWFSALGEVRGLSNGAGEESFPGLAEDSISLLQNFLDTPDQTSEIIAAQSWANVLWFFTRREGFVLTGDGGLLDNNILRDFWPAPSFRVGCAGPQAISTTPYGLAWMSPERNLWLFAGSRGGADLTASLIDIGFEKQKLLNRIDDRELERMQLLYFAPMNSLVCRFTTYDSTNHLLFYSFDIQDPQTGITGGWFEFTDVDATAIGTMFDRNKEFLLVGEADGEIRVVEQITGNSVIGKSQALIGKLILGASSNIANYPAATYRTANANFGVDGMKDVKKVYVYPYRQSVADDDVSTQAAPTVAFWPDVLDPDTPGSSTSITLSAVRNNRNFSGSIGSAGGTYADRVMVEVAFATGAPEGSADGDDFLECFSSRLCGLALTFSAKEEESVNP